MLRRIWIGSASIWLLTAGGCAFIRGLTGDDDPRDSASGAEVCQQEKGALERSKKRFKGKHPAVIEAAMRAEAACKPAPNAQCAIARADLASANAKYGRRSRATSAARRAEGKACGGATASRDRDSNEMDGDGDRSP
jgi:hypothetical protein